MLGIYTNCEYILSMFLVYFTGFLCGKNKYFSKVIGLCHYNPVTYAQAAHPFSAAIICWHCSLKFLNFIHPSLILDLNSPFSI